MSYLKYFPKYYYDNIINYDNIIDYPNKLDYIYDLKYPKYSDDELLGILDKLIKLSRTTKSSKFNQHVDNSTQTVSVGLNEQSVQTEQSTKDSNSDSSTNSNVNNLDLMTFEQLEQEYWEICFNPPNDMSVEQSEAIKTKYLELKKKRSEQENLVASSVGLSNLDDFFIKDNDINQDKPDKITPKLLESLAQLEKSYEQMCYQMEMLLDFTTESEQEIKSKLIELRDLVENYLADDSDDIIVV